MSTNYNLADQKQVQAALELRLEVLELERQALAFISGALSSYTKKQLNKYFKDHCETLSPKYSQESTRWNSETRQEVLETNQWPIYTIYIEKGYFNKITLYISGRSRSISGWDNKIYFTFYGNTNAATEEEKEASRAMTPENLRPLIDSQINQNAETIKKVKHDLNRIATITAQYNQARQAYDDILEAVHFYTRDQLTGKRDYNLNNN